MDSVTCPVCKGASHHSFWFWENEDVLMRDWAPDCRLHFSICRDCAAIFQNPPAAVAESNFDFSGFGAMNAQDPNLAMEPIDWFRQFSGHGGNALRALEVYAAAPLFENPLREKGWDVTAVSAQSLLNGEAPSADPYDVIFIYETLNEIGDPAGVLEKAYELLKEDGGVFVETENPIVQPRAGYITFTAKQKTLFSFHSLIYLLYKSGFRNHMAEVCGRLRLFAKKIERPGEIKPDVVVPKDHWSYLLYRCERNYQFAWAARFVGNFMQTRQSDPQALDKARQALREKNYQIQVIREACGAALLFAQETDTLRRTLSDDWPSTMTRVFEILKNDMALYDLLQMEPMNNFGLLTPIGRYFLNEKMVYITDNEYFTRYFSKEDAALLCDNIVKSSESVVGHLSSFL
ncbi:MAG: hypothetical protein GC154_21345 [bacterium]|nr:hypothetical protein [bacterium]